MSERVHTGPVLALTIGTAGHIDHGKTSLVKLLTGHDPDTLPEERARGMTINLGFAAFTLPDGRRVGIVDMPGHERFLHNMLAGATAIDLVLLVIAADDGVMPQTIEHFHVVRLLGIATGMIVITKTDLVDPARVAAVAEEARRLVAGSFLAEAPIVSVSARTGAGVDGLRDTLVGMVARFTRRAHGGPFRMPIERVVSIKGIGAIVAGVPRAGTIRVGDAVELLPAAAVKKVKGIRFFDQAVETGVAGQLLALRLSDMDGGEIQRGALVAAPGYFTPTRLLNVHFRAMPQLDRPIASRTAIRLHLGTSEVLARLVLPTSEPLGAGESSYAQFQLQEPVLVAPGDFCLARIPSPARLIGGGTIISCDTRRLRPRNKHWLNVVREQDRTRIDPAAALLLALRQSGEAPPTLPELARRAFLDETTAKLHLDGLVESGTAFACGNNRYLSAAALQQARNDILAALNRLHDDNPLAVGFPKLSVAGALTCHRNTLTKAIDTLIHDGKLALHAVGYQIPGRLPQLSRPKAQLAARIGHLYRETRFAAPRFEELPALLETPASVLDPIFQHLLQTGELVLLPDTIVLHREAVALSRRLLTDYLRQHGTLDSGYARTLLGTTRKYSIPILEYWDAQGLTRRTGNTRQLRETTGG